MKRRNLLLWLVSTLKFTDMMDLFHTLSDDCSRITTEKYSTSFASAIRILHKDIRGPIYSIYGFVRFADEIVDTFHDYDKLGLLEQFERETYAAIRAGISTNPILHSFQRVVRAFNIKHDLIDSFFTSMRMDLFQNSYEKPRYDKYIYGSAEVVGLMCLQVFCEGNDRLSTELQDAARSLGAAFQKVNFLRDLRYDHIQLNRTYFPGLDFKNFSEAMKRDIESEIESDFRMAANGIARLPWKARFGVHVAYKYYLSLFRKIKKLKPSSILEQRVRIPNYHKALIVMRAGLQNQFKLI